MIYVISTLSNDQVYCSYADRKDVKIVTKEILIKGGANIQNRRTLFASNQGVITPVSEDDYAELEKNPVFKLHLEKGFIKVRKTNESDARKAAENMNTKDKSAQLTPDDYKKRGFKNIPTVSMEQIETGNK